MESTSWNWKLDERDRMGLFLAKCNTLQKSQELPCRIFTCSHECWQRRGREDLYLEILSKIGWKMELLNMKEEMAERYLNEGFCVVRNRNGNPFNCRCWNQHLPLWTKLTLVWILMASKVVYLKGLMQWVKVLEPWSSPTTNVCWTTLPRCRPCDDGRPCRAFRWARIGCPRWNVKAMLNRRRTRLRL